MPPPAVPSSTGCEQRSEGKRNHFPQPSGMEIDHWMSHSLDATLQCVWQHNHGGVGWQLSPGALSLQVPCLQRLDHTLPPPLLRDDVSPPFLLAPSSRTLFVHHHHRQPNTLHLTTTTTTSVSLDTVRTALFVYAVLPSLHRTGPLPYDTGTWTQLFRDTEFVSSPSHSVLSIETGRQRSAWN